MKFVVRSITMVSVLALGVVAAHAADLTEEPVPVAPAVFNWNGFYVGVHAGAAVGDFKYPFDAYLGGDFTINGELKQSASGAFGGAQIGYNWQFNPNWVLGVEADIAASSYEGKVSADVNAGNFSANLSAGTEVEWFGTVRGRIGYAMDNVLLYGTGGFAYGDVKSSISGNIIGNIDESTSDTEYGWTIGAGLEYGITQNITFKTEYLYVDLGSQTLLDLNDGDFYAHIDSETKFHTLKAGLNYKF
ncbi:outer membrane protein [Kaistia sp. MMO-174]|uniref:outer membrane protein n=1 Tax=Kaistia sp. MMO-174 TaxID=3081256 RepID=UPI0030178B5C